MTFERWAFAACGLLAATAAFEQFSPETQNPLLEACPDYKLYSTFLQ
jgi:hypothetical protein